MHRELERINLLSLRLFLAVVELGSIAEVGRQHFIAPTAITKRMQELEEEFGVQLLSRSSRGVSPTSAGEALARHIRNMSGLSERMRTEMTEYAEGARGHVRLIANSSALIEHLALEVAEFMALHPGIRIDLLEALSDQVVRAVRDGNADLGIFAPPVHMPLELEMYPYRQDQLVALVPADHPLARRTTVAFAELLRHPMIGVHGASSLSALLAQAAGGEIAHSFRVSSNDVARWMVSKGLGITVLTEAMVVPYEECLKIRSVRISDTWATRTQMLCVRDSAVLSGSALAMFNALRQTAGLQPPALSSSSTT
jgi:DNA-binding transcriptional LysR family regulator